MTDKPFVKICNKHGALSVDQVMLDSNGKNKYYKCRQCKYDLNKKYYQNNIEHERRKGRERKKKWYLKNVAPSVKIRDEKCQIEWKQKEIRIKLKMEMDQFKCKINHIMEDQKFNLFIFRKITGGHIAFDRFNITPELMDCFKLVHLIRNKHKYMENL